MDRLSGVKQYPETGQLYSRNQWQQEIGSYKTEDKDDDMEQKEEEIEETVSRVHDKKNIFKPLRLTLIIFFGFGFHCSHCQLQNQHFVFYQYGDFYLAD